MNLVRDLQKLIKDKRKEMENFGFIKIYLEKMKSNIKNKLNLKPQDNPYFSSTLSTLFCLK